MASTLSTTTSLVHKTVRTYTDTVTSGVAGGPLTSKVTYEPATWTDGTTANTADLEWQDTRTLATTSETLNLNSLTHTLTGTTINFAEIVSICFIPNTTTTGQTLTWGNAASTSFQGPLSGTTTTETVQAGGIAFHAAPVDGWTTSSVNSLKIALNYTGTYTIKIVGRSA